MATLKVDLSHPGHYFAVGAIGLSTESNELETGRLDAAHDSLVRLMRLLGPSVLRVGGNSVDRSWWSTTGKTPPTWATSTVTPGDLYALRGLLVATGWRVLLGVDLGHFEPARAAEEARVASEILGSYLLGIEIGNEPDGYSGMDDDLRPASYDVEEYLREVEVYDKMLSAAVPGVAIYGPALGKIGWLAQMGAAASVFSEITQHYYPPVTCPAGPSDSVVHQPTVSELLSPAVRQQEDEILDMLGAVSVQADRPTRIGETGDGPCDGNSPSSPTLGSALWSLDWALRAASSGVTGLNFHGHFGLCGPDNQSPICAPSAAAASVGDVVPQAEYYGLLAASRLEGGRFVPVTVTSDSALTNMTTWATVAPNGTLRIVIDNLATTGFAQRILLPAPGHRATEESLVGPSANARSGISLGAAPVTSAGRWRPRRTTLYRAAGSFHLVVSPATAVVISLRREPASS
jgi:hypothetical protein